MNAPMWNGPISSSMIYKSEREFLKALQEISILCFFFKCAKLKQSFKIYHKIKHFDLSTKLRGSYITDMKLL